MYIESLSLRNFKCFGDKVTEIKFLPGVIGFVGDNGSGKTAVLEALKRLFSPISSERQLSKSDIHFGLGEDSQNVDEREIVIDAVFGFPDENKAADVFNDLFFNGKDSSLKVRVRFEGVYKRLVSDEDDIEVNIYIVRTLEDVSFGQDDERKIPFRGRLTQFAELIYIPAHRDSLGVTRNALKKLLRRLELSADWDEDTRSQSKKFAEQLQNTLNKTPAIKKVTDMLQLCWEGLHDGHYDATPAISVVATEFEKLIRELILRFEKSPEGGQRQLEELSEGQVSLLYFALSATLHNLLEEIEKGENLEGFKPPDFSRAPLTIFALEEPESHLSPFYLPRIINFLEELTKNSSAQAFVTSHSTGILTRIPPRNVRYFRLCQTTLRSSVREIPLPEKGSEEDKFLYQTILANPEIYFARLIIIGEGESERVVIPRIAEALGLVIDPSFVAFVSIGGRHAQHLWKLANGLGISHLTLLDFDLGRYGGGMGRIKNAAKWLKDEDMNNGFELDKIHSNESLTSDLFVEWMKYMQNEFNVFYSTPLDLDFMMLRAFQEAYGVSENENDSENMEELVFGKQGLGNQEIKLIGESLTQEELVAYKRIFTSKSKPLSHYEALAKLNQEEVEEKCPEPLKALIDVAKEKLSGAREG